MSDVAAVNQALDRQSDKFGNPMPYENFEDYRKVFDAARRWVRMVEEGPDYEAARQALLHELDWDTQPEGYDGAMSIPEIADRVVDAALVDYLTEET